MKNDSLTLELVRIPGGVFLMGSPKDEQWRYEDEGPQHKVQVPEFYMGKHPVTQAQWKAVAALPQVERKLEADPSYFKGDDCPVERVSWYEAVEFCTRLSAHTGREYRLPTEAEWEYACRAGTTTQYHFGDTLTSELANYDANQTTEVGSCPPNAFGLYDMHGNVWEWCQDHWHKNYKGAPTDGSAWDDQGESASRVLRGGSWFFNPGDCRSASRSSDLPGFRYIYIGFRVSCRRCRQRGVVALKDDLSNPQ